MIRGHRNSITTSSTLCYVSEHIWSWLGHLSRMGCHEITVQSSL